MKIVSTMSRLETSPASRSPASTANFMRIPLMGIATALSPALAMTESGERGSGEQVKHLFDPTTDLNLRGNMRNVSLSLSWQLWRKGSGLHSRPVYPLVSRALGGKCRLMSVHLTYRNYSTVERESSNKLDKRMTKARCGELRLKKTMLVNLCRSNKGKPVKP